MDSKYITIDGVLYEILEKISDEEINQEKINLYEIFPTNNIKPWYDSITKTWFILAKL